MRLLIVLTIVGIFGCAQTENGSGEGSAKAEAEASNVCIAGALVEGCQFPKPDGYPEILAGDGIYRSNAGLCPAGYVTGPSNPPFGGGCVLFSAIDQFATGFYKMYGAPYYEAFPAYVDSKCPLVSIVPGLPANICF